MGRRSEQQAAGLDRRLANATLRALRESYRDLNDALFGGVLRQASLGLGTSSQQLGCWTPETRTIEMSEPLLLERGWGAVLEVLKHEMAHQYVHEHLGITDQTAHGPAFRATCSERGIDARATGDPQEGDAEHPVLERVRKLLSLAQSSNEHEAQSAARVAQRLMLRHNIDQLSLERDDGYTSRQLGRITGRTMEAERLLGTILQDHFFVDVIWVRGFRPRDAMYGNVIEVCGRRENVEMADYVHDFVHGTAARLWQEHKQQQGIRGNRDRRAYLAGVMSGFRDQLDQQKVEQVESGLVWVGDPGLTRYFERRHPLVSTRTYYQGSGDAAREHGRRAGREIVLHRGVASSSAVAAPRQLGPGR